MDIFLLVVMGLIIGLVASLLGVGAGILSLLALAYYVEPMGFEDFEFVRVILANNAMFMGFFFLVMAVGHLRSKRFYPKQIAKIILTSLPVAITVAYMISRFDWYSTTAFYIVFCAGLIFSIYTLITHSESSFLDTCQHAGKASDDKYFGFGALSGFFQGFTATESSTILVPFLNRFCDVKIDKAIVSSTASIAPTLIGISITIFSGFPESTALPILWSVVLPLAAGSVVGFFVPSGTLNKIGLRLASYTFSFFLLIIVIRILILEVFYF